MYDDAMTAVHTHLIKKSDNEGLTYTTEILPERDRQGKMSVHSIYGDLALTLPLLRLQHMAHGPEAGPPGVLLRRLAHARRSDDRRDAGYSIHPSARGRAHRAREARLDDRRGARPDVYGDAQNGHVSPSSSVRS